MKADFNYFLDKLEEIVNGKSYCFCYCTIKGSVSATVDGDMIVAYTGNKLVGKVAITEPDLIETLAYVLAKYMD